MSGYTQNLELFKYNTTTDGNDKFNIDVALNDNFDKIDAFAGNVESGKANVDLSNLSPTGQAIIDAKQNANTAVKHTANTAVGSTIQPVFIDANGNAQTCNLSTLLDGPWVYRMWAGFSSIAKGTYECDLTSYLGVSANSTVQHLILFNHVYYAGSDNSKKGVVYSDVIDATSYITDYGTTGSMMTTDYGRTTGYIGIMPVKTKMYLKLEHAFSLNNLHIVGYRRLGVVSQ